MTPLNLHQKIWYMGCHRCYKGTSADYNQVYTCHNCKNDDTYALPRARLTARLEDSTGTLDGAFYGTHAEKIIGLSALDLFAAEKEGNISELMATISPDPRPPEIYHVRISGHADARQYSFAFPSGTTSTHTPPLTATSSIPIASSVGSSTKTEITNTTATDKQSDEDIIWQPKRSLDFSSDPISAASNIPSIEDPHEDLLTPHSDPKRRKSSDP